jgi:hypothetical protein
MRIRIPVSYSVKHRVGLYLHSHPHSALEQICSHVAGPRSNYVKEQTLEMLRDGLIFESANGGYHLFKKYDEYFAQIEEHPQPKKEVVPPRDASLFVKPWSGKYNVSAVANRPDAGESREISFKTGGTGFAPFRGAVL